jgi:tryptophan-rich sensory protein
MKSKSKSNLVLSILIPLAVGALSSLLSGKRAYAVLNKPSLSPPAYLFPLVWTILYVWMGISSYLIASSRDPQKEKAIRTYKIQLFFNFFWSILFFGMSSYFLSFLWLLLLLAFILLMLYRFYKIEPLAAYLQIPYFLWCVFAAYLNFMIYRMN